MNEAAWLADAADPQAMLAFVQRTVSESCGTMGGRMFLPDPLHPGTPSG